MAKSNPGDTPSTSSAAGPIAPAKFCAHCGYALASEAGSIHGDLVAFSAPDAAFCCHCGAALDAAGKCPNQGKCKFAGFTPRCG